MAELVAASDIYFMERKPPINRAVSYQWHKERCQHETVSFKKLDPNHCSCLNCGQVVQVPTDLTGHNVWQLINGSAI